MTLASTVLEQWSGIPSAVRTRTSFANQLTETSDDPGALEQVHPTDLRRIKDVWIDVAPDRDWWLERKREHDQRALNLGFERKTDEFAALEAPPPLTPVSVSFRLADWIATGVQVEVTGPDRTNVEGLAARLSEILNRSASGPTNLPSGYGLIVIAPGILIGFATGSAAVRVFNLAPTDHHWQWQEIAVPAAATLVGAALFAAFGWALPSLEILNSGERSRYDRFRALLLSGLGAVVAGVVATALWAVVS